MLRLAVYHSLRICCGIAIIVSAAIANEALENQEVSPPYPLDKIVIPFPILARHLVTGYAEVLYEVGADGIPRDFVVLRETHPAFSKAIINSVKKSLYQPAIIQGRSVASQITFKNRFRLEGGAAEWKVNAQSPLEMPIEGKVPLLVYPPHTLDEPLEAIESVMPQYPPELLDKRIMGGVLLEYYIDKKGNVRAPRALSASAEAFTDAAIQAMRQWKFHPPKKGGRSVCVIARQQVKFGDY